MATYQDAVTALKQNGYSDSEINSILSSRGITKKKTFGDKLKDVGKDMATTTVLRPAELLAQSGRAAYDPLIIKSALGIKLTDEENRKLANRKINFVLPEEQVEKEFGSRKDILKSGTKATAGAASLAIPGGVASKPATALGRILMASGVGGVSGGLYGYGASKEGEELKSTAGGALGGAITGGAIRGVGELVRALSKGSGAAGSAMRKGVLNPQAKPHPTMYSKKEQVYNDAKHLFKLKGSATNQLKQVDETYKALSQQSDDLLSQNTKTVNFNKLKKEMIKNIEESGEHYATTNNEAYANALNRKLSLLSKKANNGTLTAKDISQFKLELGKELTRAFDALDEGGKGKLVIEDRALLDLWKELDDVITTLAPEAKEITQKISLLYPITTGLSKSANKQGIRLFGNVVPTTRLTQSTSDFLGRILEAGGGKKPQLNSNALLNILGAETFDRLSSQPQTAASSVATGTGQIPSGAVTGSGQTSSQGGQTTTQTTGQMQPAQPKQLSGEDKELQAAFLQLMLNDPANADTYGQMATAMLGSNPMTGNVSGEGGFDITSLPAAVQGDYIDTQIALRQLDGLESAMPDFTGTVGPLRGRVRGANPYDQGGQEFQALYRTMKQIIGKGLEGGVLRKEDEEKYEDILPNIKDMPSTIDRKIERLRMALEAKQYEYELQYNGTSSGNDVSNTLLQLLSGGL